MPNVIIVLGAVFLGVFSRWLPHPPNFTPVIAIAIFMGLKFQKKSYALITPLLVMLISDIFLGFDSTAVITYPALMLLAFGVQFMRTNKVIESKAVQVIVFGSLGSLWFYLTSNAAVWWFTGMYSLNFEGLMASYVAGIPFFHNTYLSTLIFTSVLMLVDKWVSQQILPSFVKN